MVSVNVHRVTFDFNNGGHEAVTARTKRNAGSRWRLPAGLVVVEAAGIEPASANPTLIGSYMLSQSFV